MKKVLVVMNATNVYGGGIVKVILNQKKILRNVDNIHVDYAINTIEDSDEIELFEENGSDFFYLPNKKENIFKYFITLFLICKKGYDCIHVHGSSSLMFLELFCAKCAGVKRRIAHSHNSTCEHLKLNYLISPLFRKSYTTAVACSKVAGEWLYGSDFIVLNNAIDVNLYRYDSIEREKYRRQLKISEDTLLIGCIGNLVEQKNHSFIISVISEISKLRNIFFVLVGTGVLMELLEKMIMQLGLSDKVLLLGNRDDVPSLLSAMDVFVLPSKWEGLPLVLVEAQAAGLPCIVSDQVSKEAKLINDIYITLPLECNRWVSELNEISVNNNREASSQIVIDAGFDSKRQMKNLLQLYEV